MLFLENTEEKILWKHLAVKYGSATVADGIVLAYRQRLIKAPLTVAQVNMGELEETVRGVYGALAYTNQSPLIAAIKAVREKTNWSLKDSKDFVDEMVEKEGLIARH